MCHRGFEKVVVGSVILKLYWLILYGGVSVIKLLLLFPFINKIGAN